MTDVKNELPVAVHIASGGDARVRSGGTVISLNAVTNGSFQVTNGTRFRLYPCFRDSANMVAIISYSNPATLQNAVIISYDLNEFVDDVPEGTIVYFKLVDVEAFQQVLGDTRDYFYVSFYK